MNGHVGETESSAKGDVSDEGGRRGRGHSWQQTPALSRSRLYGRRQIRSKPRVCFVMQAIQITRAWTIRMASGEGRWHRAWQAGGRRWRRGRHRDGTGRAPDRHQGEAGAVRGLRLGWSEAGRPSGGPGMAISKRSQTLPLPVDSRHRQQPRRSLSPRHLPLPPRPLLLSKAPFRLFVATPAWFLAPSSLSPLPTWSPSSPDSLSGPSPSLPLLARSVHLPFSRKSSADLPSCLPSLSGQPSGS